MIQQFHFFSDLLRALLWKHNRAERLTSLAQSKQAWFDTNQGAFWDAWLRDVFDLRTANAFGLQIWARILGVRLSLPVGPSNPDKPTWGFGALYQNFGRGNFGRVGDGTIGLTTEEQRAILRLRYFQLTSRCTIPDINHALKEVFGEQGPAYVLDPMNMEFITYVFGFQPGTRLLGLLRDFDILPRPSAVGIRFVISTRDVFGFGPYNRNFGNGTFASEGT